MLDNESRRNRRWLIPSNDPRFREIYDITRNWEQNGARLRVPLIAAAPFADEQSAATVNDFRPRQRSEDCAGTFLNLWSERATFLRRPRRGTKP